MHLKTVTINLQVKVKNAFKGQTHRRKVLKEVCWWGHMTMIPQIYEILP